MTLSASYDDIYSYDAGIIGWDGYRLAQGVGQILWGSGWKRIDEEIKEVAKKKRIIRRTIKRKIRLETYESTLQDDIAQLRSEFAALALQEKDLRQRKKAVRAEKIEREDEEFILMFT